MARAPTTPTAAQLRNRVSAARQRERKRQARSKACLCGKALVFEDGAIREHGLWLYRDTPDAKALTETARRLAVAWPPDKCPLCGRPMLAWVIDQALGLEPERVLVVVGYQADEVQSAVAKLCSDPRIRGVVQEPQLGTGHALQCCLPELGRSLL